MEALSNIGVSCIDCYVPFKRSSFGIIRCPDEEAMWSGFRASRRAVTDFPHLFVDHTDGNQLWRTVEKTKTARAQNKHIRTVLQFFKKEFQLELEGCYRSGRLRALPGAKRVGAVNRDTGEVRWEADTILTLVAKSLDELDAGLAEFRAAAERG
jgi:hypothetical protein